MSEEKKIILIADLIESNKRKKEELDYYNGQLEELERKMSFIQQEIDLTNRIIEVIEQEKADLSLSNK